MKHRLLSLLFPPRCVLCRKLLREAETGLCHKCRQNTPEVTQIKNHIPFVARSTALWYYKDDARKSLLRFKFYNRRGYAGTYGALLAMKISKDIPDFDLLSWIPIAPQRRRRRGYDQVQLIAQAVCAELDLPLVPTLRKIRNAPPQSSIRSPAARKANILGAYTAENKEQLQGKRILLLDDILTTGATSSEAARTLLIAGAKEVYLATMATASHK